MTARPLGATVTPTGVSFRVWAPDASSVSVDFDTAGIPALELERDAEGYFEGHSAEARHGTAYRYRLDAAGAYPDPYSRSQPRGPHGPSLVIDPTRYAWQDSGWKGLDPLRQVVYELHVGTFTPAGTYAAAAEQFAELKTLGITAVEILPVNEFVGEFGWGYDGVNWFAPYHAYGDPDALRAFVDRAHAAGLGVILDVVYNHFGHDGNYLGHFSQAYLDHGAENPWGGAPHYSTAAMRQMVIDNAAYWMREFHIDGLRLDATQNIHDPRHPQLLADLCRAARDAAAPRTVVISGEDFLQRAPLLASVERGGPQLDQLWNDDFHHSARVAVTGTHEGYFRDYRGRAQELMSALLRGYLFQGQYSGWDKAPRGSPVTDEPRSAFVVYTQNHDQVANTLYGQRLPQLTSPARYRALTAAMLLGPSTPLIFMGQEFNATAPFAYFADYPDEAAGGLWAARRRELKGFEQYADADAQATVMNPCSRETVRRSTLDFSERATNGATLLLFRDLLRLRREDEVLDARPAAHLQGATLTETAFVLRWFAADGGDRLLIVNLGAQIDRRALPEPLLAPPPGHLWRTVWSSESPRYGGMGALDTAQPDGWQCAAESAQFLSADPRVPVTRS